MTGFGATAPKSLFTLSLEDASSTLLTALSQSNGDSIAFNPLDGLLYRVTQGNHLTFQKIDPATLTTTNIAVTPADRVIQEPTAPGFDPQTGAFLLAESEDKPFRLTPTGEVTLLATLETGQTKGLAFVPEPSTALLLGLGTLAALAVQRRRSPRLPR